MITQTTARISLLASALLLAACGSGSGSSGGLVRVDDPPPTTPPESAKPEPCPEPISGDCIVSSDGVMQGGRTSAGALIVDGASLSLGAGAEPLPANLIYSFSAGTQVEADAMLRVYEGRTLVSDVTNAGALVIWGSVKGDIVNTGSTLLNGEVIGNLDNSGRVLLNGALYGNAMSITGNFYQSGAGTFVFSLAPAGWDSPGPLQVMGFAQLAGTLELALYSNPWDYGYTLPDVPSAQHLLHADGGVFGTFDSWTSPGLFVDGSVRYGSNDVWFDLVRLSIEEMMASASAGNAMTLASARRLDAAFALADAFAATPRDQLSLAQRRFLESAARIQHIASLSAAARSLASLSGRGQSLLETQLHGQGATLAARIATRLDTQPHQPGVQAWTSALDPSAGSASDGIHGQLHGFSQWLGPRLLVGGSVATGEATLRLDDLDGQAWGPAPMSSIFARVGNDRWYGFGLLGAGKARLEMQRPIDIGDGRSHVAWSRREVTLAQAHGELGRTLSVAGGRLVPYAAVDVSQLRDRGFAEQGDTGLELVAQPGQRARVSGAMGTRYDRTWAIGASGWLRLDIDAQLRQQLGAYGDPLQAAFAGTPASLFPLDDPTQPATTGWLRLGLLGGRGDAWTWSLDQAWASSGPARNQWLLAVRRAL